MLKYTHILQTDKIQKYFYLMIIKKMIKNLLKLFNETDKNDKNSVLLVISDILLKRILKKEALFFQILSIELLKESILALKKKMKQLLKLQKKTQRKRK